MIFGTLSESVHKMRGPDSHGLMFRFASRGGLLEVEETFLVGGFGKAFGRRQDQVVFSFSSTLQRASFVQLRPPFVLRLWGSPSFWRSGRMLGLLAVRLKQLGFSVLNPQPDRCFAKGSTATQWPLGPNGGVGGGVGP